MTSFLVAVAVFKAANLPHIGLEAGSSLKVKGFVGSDLQLVSWTIESLGGLKTIRFRSISRANTYGQDLV